MDKQDMINYIYKIIGKHRNVGNEIVGDFYIKEVMIGDVLNNFNTEIDKSDETDWNSIITILELWKNKRLPIEEQYINCIAYIYNLIKK